ncbi:MAG: protein-methionine-sulfoxide reductase catalytic subunit MsrP [Paracoccaceae bacterium]
MIYHRKPNWMIKENLVTDETLLLNRRKLLAGMGIGAGAAALGLGAEAATPEAPFTPMPGLNSNFEDAGRGITAESITSKYNNFYEFGSSKRIAAEAQKLSTDDWVVEIDGMVNKPFQIGIEDLLKRTGVEERIYRHRCVEAWSMVVPWIGFPMAKLIDLAQPMSGAKYIRFETFMDTKVAKEQKVRWYPWPYVEGFTMAEATNDLAFMVVGAYGKVLHKQFGAPLRVHMPWKFGFKSIKSIVKVTFTDERPVGFWENLIALEYGFWANVNPAVDHPRWSQATEKPLDSDGRIPTHIFNGYGEHVAHLYEGMDDLGDRLWR